MTNAKKFEQIFGIYATELWVMSEEDFLKWLNAEARTEDWIPCSERLPKSDGEYLVTEQFSNGFPPEVDVLCFSTDLSKVDRYDFEKGESGFYRYDDEWGYIMVNDVTAWREKPEPYTKKKGGIMTANKHQEESCYNCVYYHHDYWNCQGAEKPCHEYSPDNDETEEES